MPPPITARLLTADTPCNFLNWTRSGSSFEVVSNDGISFLSAAALGSITNAWTEVMASIIAMMTAATALCLTVDGITTAASAITPQINPHLKYPGKSAPTISPAVSRLYVLKMTGVRIKVNRDAPPTQKAIARRYIRLDICIGFFAVMYGKYEP